MSEQEIEKKIKIYQREKKDILFGINFDTYIGIGVLFVSSIVAVIVILNGLFISNQITGKSLDFACSVWLGATIIFESYRFYRYTIETYGKYYGIKKKSILKKFKKHDLLIDCLNIVVWMYLASQLQSSALLLIAESFVFSVILQAITIFFKSSEYDYKTADEMEKLLMNVQPKVIETEKEISDSETSQEK